MVTPNDVTTISVLEVKAYHHVAIHMQSSPVSASEISIDCEYSEMYSYVLQKFVRSYIYSILPSKM